MVAVLLLPAAAQAQTGWGATAGRWGATAGKVGAQSLDLLVFRPLETVALALGCAAFVPAAALSAPGGLDAVREALDYFVVEPGKRTFVRPLGEF